MNQLCTKPRRGFTLMELLLALALTVIVATILASALYTAFRARDSIELSVEAVQSASIAADLMAQEIPLALPPSPASSANAVMGLPLPGLGATTQTLLGPFIGTDQSLDFYLSGHEPKSALQSDVREIQYLLLNDPSVLPPSTSQMLIRRVRTNILEDSPTDPPDEILARHVIKLNFKYYDGSIWLDTWDSTLQSNRLPLAVQVTLELAPLHAGQPSRVDIRTVSLPCATPAPEESSGLGGFLR